MGGDARSPCKAVTTGKGKGLRAFLQSIYHIKDSNKSGHCSLPHSPFQTRAQSWCEAQKCLFFSPQAQSWSQNPAWPWLPSHGDWEEQELTSGYPAVCTTVQTHLWPMEVIAPQFFPSLLPSRGASTSRHAALGAGPDVAPSPLEPTWEGSSIRVPFSARLLPTCRHLMKNNVKSKYLFFLKLTKQKNLQWLRVQRPDSGIVRKFLKKWGKWCVQPCPCLPTIGVCLHLKNSRQKQKEKAFVSTDKFL